MRRFKYLLLCALVGVMLTACDDATMESVSSVAGDLLQNVSVDDLTEMAEGVSQVLEELPVEELEQVMSSVTSENNLDLESIKDTTSSVLNDIENRIFISVDQEGDTDSVIFNNTNPVCTMTMEDRFGNNNTVVKIKAPNNCKAEVQVWNHDTDNESIYTGTVSEIESMGIDKPYFYVFLAQFTENFDNMESICFNYGFLDLDEKFEYGETEYKGRKVYYNYTDLSFRVQVVCDKDNTISILYDRGDLKEYVESVGRENTAIHLCEFLEFEE